MSKTLSAKYYQENKERQKKLAKDIKIFLKKKKKRSGNIVVNLTNISKDKKRPIEYKKYYRMSKNAL